MDELQGTAMMPMSEIFGIAAASAVLVAVIAWIGDRRRFRRKLLDDVGFMPWTPIFFFALLAAVVLLGITAKAWLAS